ncbi:hypothetical protein C923_05538 [Plasmodium falciparum UGT5.1]|uniref:Uncharacterized protein n=1 Tax=Plasmodium falciparum UGT5.1 TaxID=1237627 RepID=W7J5L0_PLAFA|nr:hypothetical protein C923_05538 [Plasmodium falciparum UGT5.1]
MLLQKHFKLVPNQDNNLEELINELALSKKNINEIRKYGTKLKRHNDDIHKGYDNNIEDKENYNNLSINKDNIICENDNNLIYKEDNITYKKNNKNIINNNFQVRTKNGSISNLLLNKKRREEKMKEQTNISKKQDNVYNHENCNDKSMNKIEYSMYPIDKNTSEYNLLCSSNVLNLSNFKDNALFQRIFKSIEEEKMKSKYEKIKNKKEQWQKRKLKNEHIRNEHIRNEYIRNEYIRNEHIRNEHIRNEHIKNEYIKNEHIRNEHIRNEYIRNEHIRNEYIKNENIKNKKIKNEKTIYERSHNKSSDNISDNIIQLEELSKDEKKKKNEILKAKRKCSYNNTFRSFSPLARTSEYTDNISFNTNNENKNNKFMKHNVTNYNEDVKRKRYIYYNDMNKKETKNIKYVDNNIKPLYHIWNKKNYTTDCDKKKKKKKEDNKKGKDVLYNFVMEKRGHIENCKKKIINNNNINENFLKSYKNKKKHERKCKSMNNICDVKNNGDNVIDYKKMCTTFKNLKHIKKKNILRKKQEYICDNIINKYNNSSEHYLNITTSNESVKSLKSNSAYIFKYKNSYIPNSLLIKNQINNIKENKKNKSIKPSSKQDIFCKSGDINLYVHKYQYLVLKKRKRKRKFIHVRSIIEQKGGRRKCIHMFKKWIHEKNVKLSNCIINDNFNNNIKYYINNKSPSKLNKNEVNWIIDNDIYMNSTECSDKREDIMLTSHIISSNDNNGYIPDEEIHIENANTSREEVTQIDIINNKEQNISSNSVIKGKLHNSDTNDMKDTHMLNNDISINLLNNEENIEDKNNMMKSFNDSFLEMNNENNKNLNENNGNMIVCTNIDIEEQNNTQKDNIKEQSDISYTIYSQQDEKKDGTLSNNYTNNYTNNCLNSYIDLENKNIPFPNNDKIYKDVLSFYNMYKDKVKFLLLEECNYLKELRNVIEENSKNMSENLNNNISKNEYYSNSIFEKNQSLFDELIKTLKSNKMSENNTHSDLFNMNRNSENEKNMKKNIIESNKNDLINFYKDPINFLFICNQTEKRIKEIERILNINDNDNHNHNGKVDNINDEYNMEKTKNIFEKKETNCNKDENKKNMCQENNFLCNNNNYNNDIINIINPSQLHQNKIEETNFRSKNPFLSVFNFNSLILANTITDIQKEKNDSVKKKKKTNKYIKVRKNKYFKFSHLYTMYIQNNFDYLYKKNSSIYYIINLKSVDMMCHNVDIRYIVLNNIRRKNFTYSFPIIKRNYYIKRHLNCNNKINPKRKNYIFLFKYNKFFYKMLENHREERNLIRMKYKCTPQSIMIPILDKDNFLNSKICDNNLKYVHNTTINKFNDLTNKEENNMVYFPSIDNIKKEKNIDIVYGNMKNVLYRQEDDKNVYMHVHNNNIHLNNNSEYIKSNSLEKNDSDLFTSNILNNNLMYQEENDNNPLRKNKLNHSYNSIKSLDIKNDIKLEENNKEIKIKEMKINYNKPCIVHLKKKNDIPKQTENNKINMENKNMLSNSKEYITNSIKYEHSNNYYNNMINNEKYKYHTNNNIYSLNMDNTCDNYSSIYLQKDEKNKNGLNGNKKKKEYFFNLYESNYNPFHSKDKVRSMYKLNNSYDNIVNTLCSSVGGGESFHLSNNKNYKFNQNKSSNITRTSEHINLNSQRNKDKSKIINQRNSNEHYTKNDMIHNLNVREKTYPYDDTNILENKNFDNINKLRNKRNTAYKKKDNLFFNNDINKNIITNVNDRDYVNVSFEDTKNEGNLINNKKLQKNNFNSNSIYKCVRKNMNEDNLFLYNNKISSDLNIDSKFLYSNNITSDNNKTQNECHVDNYNFMKKEGKNNYSYVKPIMNTLINNNINNKSKIFIKEEDILGKNKKENFKLCESNKNSFYFSNENMNSNKLLNVETNKHYNIKALSYNINRNINQKKLNESKRYDSSFNTNNEEGNFIDNENWECNYKDELKTNCGNSIKYNNEYLDNYYINSLLSHSFNIYDNKSIYDEGSLLNGLSSSIMDTDNLDEIIQKIRTLKTINERNNNYISCLYCDKYLFKLDNYHEDFFFVCSNKEELRKEKYTCSICKHKLRVLNKYKKDNVQKYINIVGNDTIRERSTNMIIKNMDNNIKVKRDTINENYMEDEYMKHYNTHDINYVNNNNYNDGDRNYEENHSDYTKGDDTIIQSNMIYLNKDFQDGFSYNIDKKKSIYSRKKKFCDFKELNNFGTKNLYSDVFNVPKECNKSSTYTSHKSNIFDEKNELSNINYYDNNYANDIYYICNNKSNNDMNRTFNHIHKNYKSYSDDEINKIYNKNDHMVKFDKSFSLDMCLLKLRRKNLRQNFIPNGRLHNNNKKKNSLYDSNGSSLIIDRMTNVNVTNMNTYEKEKSIYNINIKEINENKNITCERNFINRTIENTGKCYNHMNDYISENNNNNNNIFENQIEKNYMLNEDKYKGVDNKHVTNLNIENMYLKEEKKKQIKEIRTSNNESYPLINPKHNFFKSLLINGDKNMLNISNDENNCFKKYYSTYIN